MNEKVTENPNRSDNYDAHIVPAETQARMEREGGNFKHKPDREGDIDTTEGYTVDNEGLLNNFAVEPEMYVEEPGDLREKEEAEAAEREEELKEINEHKPGSKGQGVI
ncbi:MAG: hypothetical protein ACRC2R_02070 [Xenococcaceae cyanobacterium]